MWTLLDTIVDCVRSRQGHPTKFFYKITIRKGEYCLEISKARLSSIKAKHRPLVYDKRSFSTYLSTILGVEFFTIHSTVVVVKKESLLKTSV